MAIRERYLTPFLLLFSAVLMTTNGLAQSAPAADVAPPVMFRTLAVGNTIPFAELFYENRQHKSVPILVGDTAPSELYESPPGGIISFYREQAPIPPETRPRRIPVTNVRLGKDSMYWIVLSTTKNEGGSTVTPFVISDSWETHPFETIRVLNFSRRRVAIQVGDRLKELATNEFELFPYPAADSELVRFKTATNDGKGWILRKNTPQPIIHNTRASIVISDIEPTEHDPNPEGINVRNMIDPLQPPKPVQ
ncbi:MAG TPA: hypothetical protein VK985_04450 [Rariglobus sp.]|nr:hypothetical protein [Rariglobus sp.]